MTATSDPAVIEEIRRQLDRMQEKIATEPAGAGLVPLRIGCVMSSCKNGRHCLDHIRKPRPGYPATEPGRCRDCGVYVADLPEPGGRRYGDPGEVIETCIAVQTELIRAHYWHVPIDQWALNQARRLGRRELHQRVAEAVTTALVNPGAFSGRGASYDKKIVSYAQHATASCCRTCAAYWHGLPLDGPPSTAQLRHVITAAATYLDLRLPNLPNDPESWASVGSIRRKMLPSSADLLRIDDAVVENLLRGCDPAGIVRSADTTLQLVSGHGADGGYLIAHRADVHHRKGA